MERRDKKISGDSKGVEGVLSGCSNDGAERSKEELVMIIEDMQKKMKKMYSDLCEMNMFNIFKRLDYLFKVIENDEVFSKDYVDSIVKEVMELLDIRGKDSGSEGVEGDGSSNK